MLTRWKKVAAASKVVAVCLEIDRSAVALLGWGERSSLLGDFIGLHHSLCSVECLLRKLLDVSLTGYIVDDRILARVFGFGLGPKQLAFGRSQAL